LQYMFKQAVMQTILTNGSVSNTHYESVDS